MTNHIAYRISSKRIEKGQMVEGVFVWGQRLKDFNWDYLAEFKNEEEAISYMKKLAEGKPYCYIYKESGHAIR